MNPDITYVRCFDLGGGGLKTGLVSYNSKTGEMKLEEKEVQLGKCPSNKKVKEWVREKMIEKEIGNLDTEYQNGYLFGFSLAGIEKLWEGNKTLEQGNMQQLFNLKERVSWISDGSAHTLASAKMMEGKQKSGNIWNFSVGTGVGMGFTDASNKLHTDDELKKFLGTEEPWNAKVPSAGNKPVYQVCSSKKFDDILKRKSVDEAFGELARGWASFIQTQIIERGEVNGEAPTAIVFTGGNIDHYPDRLVNEINKQGLKIKAFEGPKNAALVGAAWRAIEQHGKKSRTELNLKFPDTYYRDLGLEDQQVRELKDFIEINFKENHKTGKKFSKGQQPDGSWIPRDVQFHIDGKITITLEGGEQDRPFNQGDLYDLIEGKNLGQNLPKEVVTEQKTELKFQDAYYRDMGLETHQRDQIKKFIEENVEFHKTGKKFVAGTKIAGSATPLQRDVIFHTNGMIITKLMGGPHDRTFNEGDFYDLTTGKNLGKKIPEEQK